MEIQGSAIRVKELTKAKLTEIHKALAGSPVVSVSACYAHPGQVEGGDTVVVEDEALIITDQVDGVATMAHVFVDEVWLPGVLSILSYGGWRPAPSNTPAFLGAYATMLWTR